MAGAHVEARKYGGDGRSTSSELLSW